MDICKQGCIKGGMVADADQHSVRMVQMLVVSLEAVPKRCSSASTVNRLERHGRFMPPSPSVR